MVKLFQRLLQPKNKPKVVRANKMASLLDVDLFGKTVLLRADFNVPIVNGRILDNYRIKQTIPTIKELLKQRCKVIIISHLGRPNGKANPLYSLTPVAKELTKLLPKRTIHFLPHCIGKDIKERIRTANQGQIILLENLRFYIEEQENDLSFAHSLADLADIYVFDAFAVAHRRHSSTVLVPAFLPSVQGLLVQDEVETINAAKATKEKSLWIIGGAKLEKLSIVKAALDHAEWIYVGGALCFSFLRAKGIHVGNSKFTKESIEIAREILTHKNADKIILPNDIVCSNSMSDSAKATTVQVNNIPSSAIGLDLGINSTNKIINLIKSAKQVIWNGPLGYTENTKYRKSTVTLIKELQTTHARTICGGGETNDLLVKQKARNSVTHASTGGGASLALLSGEHLPALDALAKSAKKFKLL